MTRFLTPYLAFYSGLALFMDCDMLCLTDIAQVLEELPTQPDKDVWACQHNYTPKTTTKFLGQTQTKYPRKNWSSFMVFDAERCTTLTPYYVNTATGLDLHRFQWTTDEQIGSLPLEWNHLVGEYEPNPKAKVLHYTLGGPYFKDYENCDHADLWFAEYQNMTGKSWKAS
jgi:hypothetical protein